MAQVNSLTKAKVNVLRFKGDLEPAALLHDYTFSTDASDYLFILRQNISSCSARPSSRRPTSSSESPARRPAVAAWARPLDRPSPI